MAGVNGQRDANPTVEILRDILITQLGLAGVPQQNIRKVVGCSINRVNAIVRHLKSAKRGAQIVGGHDG